MRWMVRLDDAAPTEGLDWARGFLARYDTTRIEWIRIDRGRGAYQGVYGRCWYPSPDRPSYRISCQVPGPFPCHIVTRRSPLYRRENGSFPRAPAGCRRTTRCIDDRTGREWYRVIGVTEAPTLDAGIVWIVAHEAYHFLRRTRQVPGRNDEIRADAFADEQLAAFLTGRRPVPPPAATRPPAATAGRPWGN
jgi:hypothetical protein